MRKLFLSFLLPAAILLCACGPEDIVNPVTPPSPKPGTEEPQTPEEPDGPDTPPVTEEADPMTVCTFNIRYANNSDTYPDGSSAAWSARTSAVKKFFDKNKPDIVGLQEVRQEQSKWFSKELGAEYGYYDVSRDNASGSSVATAQGEGVGILYRKDRFELVNKDFFWLDATPRERPAQNSDGTYGAWNSACRRVTVYAVLKDKQHNNALIYFFSTHYDHKSADARKNASELSVTQMKALCKVSELKNANAIIFLLGDLNTTYDNSQLKTLNDNMSYARLAVKGSDQYTSTFNGYGGSGQIIDHIYYGGKAVKPLKYWVDRSTEYGVPFISDHYPVLLQWEYQ